MVLKLNSSANPQNYPFFKKRLLESIGLLIFTASFVLFLSVLSFNNNDPSFTNLTDNTTQNIIGKYGAYSSDMLLNLFGAGSIVIFLIGFACFLIVFNESQFFHYFITEKQNLSLFIVQI